MPRIKRTEVEVFKLNELSEEAQDKVIEGLYSLNVDHEWWEGVYEDADNAGIKITSFDCSRHDIEGELNSKLADILKAILCNHGEICETWKTAKTYQDRLNVIETKERVKNLEDRYDNDYNDALNELEQEFLCDILRDYLTFLRQE